MLLLLVACAEDDADGGDADTDVTGATCDATVATAIHGETPVDTIAPGAVVDIVSGPQGGFHMDLGMEVVSSGTDVAWRIDLYDAVTGDLVGTVGDTPFSVLTSYDASTCVGHLNGRVFIGDGSAQTYDFACALEGTAIEARGWVAPLATNGEVPTESTQVTLEIVAGAAPC